MVFQCSNPTSIEKSRIRQRSQAQSHELSQPVAVRHDPPLFASLSAASEFDGAADWAPLDVANGAWGFDAVSVRSEALWQRLAQQLPGNACFLESVV